MARRAATFEDMLSRTIDDTLRAMLGEGVAELYYVLKGYGIRSDRLGERPENFESAMQEIFKVGWNVFKKAIIRSVCQQYDLSIDMFADHNFPGCIEIIRQEFLLQASSRVHNRIIDKVQNSKLKAHNDIILKLSLPDAPLSTSKSCKLCNKTIDVKNNKMEGLLAELCDECWELQNNVWEVVSEVACITKGKEYKSGDYGI
ncbi:MAG: hypothetical protein QXU32_03405 [Nitrososphaerales archaeon]